MSDPQTEPLTKESFAELYTRFRHKIISVARRFFPHSPAEVEEIAQEAFARAWKYRHTYRPGKNSFQNWLWKITKNVALERLNRLSRMREIAFLVLEERSDAALPEFMTDSAPLPDDLVIRQQGLARLAKILDKLSPEEYFLLFLRHGLGFSLDQLAKFFQVHRPAVTRRHRAVLAKVTRQML